MRSSRDNSGGTDGTCSAGEIRLFATVTALDWRAVWFISSIPLFLAFVDKHLDFRQVVLGITSEVHLRMDKARAGERGKLIPHVATLAFFSFLAARALLRSALAALASGVLAVLVNRSFKRTALPESWRR